MLRRDRARGAGVLALAGVLVAQVLLSQPTAATAATARTTVVFGAKAVPVGFDAVVHLQGPNGFSRTYTGATRRVLRNVPVGTYSITSTPIVVSTSTASTPAATYYPAVPAAKTVAAGGTVRLKADFTTAVAPGVVVATAKTITSTSIAPGAVPGTAGTVRVRGSFATGALLVSGVSAATPDGLLVRLGAVKARHKTTTTFAAVTVPLPTVLLRGTFTKTVSGSGAVDGTSPGSDPSAVAPATTGAYSLPDPFRATIPCSSSASMGVEANVQAKVSEAITAKWDAANPAGDSVKVAAKASAAGAMNVWVTGAAACSLTKSELGGPIAIGTVQVQVGPIPVVLVQTLQFVAEGNAGTSAAMSASLTSNVTTTSTLRSTPKGHVSTIQDPVMTAHAGVPSATSSGALTLSVGAKLRSNIFGIDGPYASVRIGPNLTVDSSSNPWWVVTGHVMAGIGADVAALGIHQAEPRRLDSSWPLRDAGAAMPQ